MRRPEGHKLVADLIKNSEIKKGDIILLQYYSQNRFTKYFDFSDYRVITINKGNFPDFLSENHSYSEVLYDGKTLYKDIFSNYSNPYFENKLNQEILNNMKPGQSVDLIILNSVSFINPDAMVNITKNDALYQKQPLLFMVFSYLKNKTFIEMSKTLTLTRIEQKGSWMLIKFTKLNNIRHD